MIQNSKVDKNLVELYEKEYEVIEWFGEIWAMPYSFLKSGKGSTIDIELGNIFLILDPNEGIILFEHRFVKLIQKDFQFLISNSRNLGIRKNITDYKSLNVERINKKHEFKNLTKDDDVPIEYRNQPKHPYEHLIDKNQRRFTSKDFK